MHDDALPLVSISLLRDALDGCGRRVHERWERSPALRIPYGPGRVRDALVAQLRAEHGARSGGDTHAADSLTGEEREVLTRALDGYRRMFVDDPATWWEVDLERATLLPKRGVELLNPIDLTVRTGDNVRTVRLLRLGGTRLLPEPLDDDRVRMTILRVAAVDGADAPLRITHADLLTGDRRDLTCAPSEVLPTLGAWLDTGIARIVDRESDPMRGTECTRCQFLHTCPAFPERAGGVMQRHDYLPPIPAFTPTSYDTFRRCALQYQFARLLKLPPSDAAGAPDEGILVHRILEDIHRHGDCHDAEVVTDVLARWGLERDPRTRGFIDRHAGRCPSPAPALGHEYDEARFHRKPLPNFIGAARFDAIWMYDGRMDVRDYKTGAGRLTRVADDPRARLQAWVLAPLAEALDCELSIRYEMLAPEHDEDPEIFIPDPDDIAAIDEELRRAAASVLADAFEPTSDEHACGFCPYRSICHASRAPGIPVWPVIDEDPSDADVSA